VIESYLDQLWIEARTSRTLILLGALVVTVLLVGALARGERKRVRGMLILTTLHVILLPVVAALEYHGVHEAARGLRLASYLFEMVAAVGMAGTVIFAVFLPRVRLPAPRILQDVVMAAAAIVAGFMVASGAGFNLSGIIATSAVLTAVIGFALQDTLGNVMGGLALQLDDSLRPGEWIKVNDVSGKVREVRWRYTAVMTRNGELVLIPNGVLMKSQVTLLAHGLQPGRWRRWCYFNVDFRYQPSDVIEAVEAALRSALIPNVSPDPPAQCVLMDIGDSQCRYAVRYWLTDPQVDDPTDSTVRTRIFFALARARIKLSMPAHAIFMTQDDEARGREKASEELDRQMKALRQVDVLRSLDDKELVQLAAELRYAPFTRGEVLTRQGAEAHWLYLIVDGTVSVRVRNDETGQEKEVSQLGAGNFFGEMSLMTGERRTATVVALGDVECYRLSAESFRRVIGQRPEQAEDFAEVLAQRKAELEATRQGLDAEARARRAQTHKQDLLDKVRGFLGFDE
jgi:small-conductance mechanosensitive channel/CRP-like cAMP-binding protein